MSKYSINDITLTAIADSIRSKAGTSDPIQVSGFADAIAAIPTGGGSSFNIDWDNDTIVTALNATEQLTLPEGYTIKDIKLAILPSAGRGSSFGSSTRWIFVYPEIMTPKIVEYSESDARYNYALYGITIGAYGSGSQTGHGGISFQTIDNLSHTFQQSQYNMRYMGLRAKTKTPNIIEGFYMNEGFSTNVFTSNGGQVGSLITGATGLIILNTKEV